MRRLRAKSLPAVVLVAVMGLTGCTDGRDLVPAGEIRSLVLQPADVPEGLARFDDAPESMERIGSEGEEARGWLARYRHADPEATDGPLVVESLARVYGNEDQAESALASHREELESGGASVVRDPPALGDEAWAVTLEQAALSGRVVYFTVAWRDRNVVAALTVQGFEGKVGLVEASALARKQQERIAAAVAA